MALGRIPREPLSRLLRFEATDGAPLAGVLFEPPRATKRAGIFLHGTGGSSIFESKRTHALAQVFLRAAVAWFPFNNRGSHIIRRLGPTLGGSAFEKIRECVFDIDAAVRELRSRGYTDITLVGHSTGANKIAVYDHYKPRNRVTRYALLGGGDDTGMLYERLGKRRFETALTKAREKIRAGRAAELVPAAFYDIPMTWGAFYDMANPNGDYNVFPFLEVLSGVRLSRQPHFRHLRAIRKPTLFLYGERDEYAYGGDAARCVQALHDALGSPRNMEFAMINGADHGFSGREVEMGETIVRWMQGRNGDITHGHTPAPRRALRTT